MSALLLPDGRRWSSFVFEVRRDAAVVMPNGRVLYDALFSRTGYQRYPKPGGGVSVEYRPPEEVFRADSLASLGLLPGTLLHSPVNFGTNFGDGAYSVRGVTDKIVVPHTDGIHTAGKLMVWCDEWNAAIESGEIADISLGYTITPGEGGTGPDGTVYHVKHTDIIGDHCAGVPEGNAGTARVITDAAPIIDPHARRATRRALADIAAMRADANPMVFDLGWSVARPINERRNDTTMDKNQLAIAYFDRVIALGPAATPKAMADAWVEICGSADDPAIRAASGAIATAAQSTYVQATVGQPSVAVEVEVGMQDAKAKLEADRKAVADERAKLERERKSIADEQAARDDVVALARVVLGQDWSPRSDASNPASAPKTTTAIAREVIGKLDAARLDDIDAEPEADRPVALRLALKDARRIYDKGREVGGGLLRMIHQTRDDNAEQQGKLDEKLEADVRELAARFDALNARNTANG